MSEVSEVVELAWREGVGPDDLARFRALLPRLGEPALAGDPATGELVLFAAWLELLSGVRVDVPATTGPAATQVVHAAAEVMAARLARERVRLDGAIEMLGQTLGRLTPSDPRGAAARAWADYALAEVGVAVTDLGTARRRFEAVAATGSPIALRIAAMLRLAAISMTRLEVEPARNLARKASALAESAKRKLHVDRARIAWAMFDHMAGDTAAMRKTLGPAIASGDPIARVLLAGAEKVGRAMELLGDGLRVATEQGDPMGYMLCILMGSRRYVQIGHDADALVTITAGIAQLAPIAPDLAAILSQERSLWQSTWTPERYSQAESRAITSLDKV